ncbi:MULTISPECIES: hypothetical protein [Comamonas]|uniref:hypothetical protein n=1 Tax=Comamonas TaxID=283 RepID=UPI00237DC1FA|nr:hypothetical protein [Comamonas aquatica]MDE1557419.1 hypothetical protein [Comamonas aquatica]
MNSVIKKGDKVRFLNTTGGGKVSRVEGSVVWVEDEDGFEIPTPVRECVVVQDNDTFMPALQPPGIEVSSSSGGSSAITLVRAQI